ncbi:MAG: hypothetical protein AB7K09_04410 [Planctomycetota bacterium]
MAQPADVRDDPPSDNAATADVPPDAATVPFSIAELIAIYRAGFLAVFGAEPELDALPEGLRDILAGEVEVLRAINEPNALARGAARYNAFESGAFVTRLAEQMRVACEAAMLSADDAAASIQAQLDGITSIRLATVLLDVTHTARSMTMLRLPAWPEEGLFVPHHGPGSEHPHVYYDALGMVDIAVLNRAAPADTFFPQAYHIDAVRRLFGHGIMLALNNEDRSDAAPFVQQLWLGVLPLSGIEVGALGRAIDQALKRWNARLPAAQSLEVLISGGTAVSTHWWLVLPQLFTERRYTVLEALVELDNIRSRLDTPDAYAANWSVYLGAWMNETLKQQPAGTRDAWRANCLEQLLAEYRTNAPGSWRRVVIMHLIPRVSGARLPDPVYDQLRELWLDTIEQCHTSADRNEAGAFSSATGTLIQANRARALADIAWLVSSGADRSAAANGVLYTFLLERLQAMVSLPPNARGWLHDLSAPERQHMIDGVTGAFTSGVQLELGKERAATLALWLNDRTLGKAVLAWIDSDTKWHPPDPTPYQDQLREFCSADPAGD